MKNYVILLAGLLCCLAAPPSSARPRELPAYEFRQLVPELVPVAECTALPTVSAVVVQVVALAPVSAGIVATPSAERSGATLQHYLSTSARSLRVRPGWRGSVGSAYTEYKAAELRQRC